ncbi:MAG TPA: Gfo/Idh/MocA family oxidoreductase [Geobacterales bacterium]|nr:Gfo/Idh/MocA family oxidoreductase [Geobacterales bacterium]
MRVAIIGCGLIGQKRALALPQGWSLALCCDQVRERAENLARFYPGAQITIEAESAAANPGVDVVIVATTHDVLAPLAARAAGAGKHVLLEKPGARCSAELDPVADAARSTGALVRVGFNHRYHRAFRKARAILDTGVLGEPMFVRARYGHGGRPGYEKEWRAVPEISGGGEAVDQGVHLIDLARWFLGEFVVVQGAAPTFYWNMPVEDNAFFLLQTESGRVAFLHASWTEWKNLFSFEYSGRCGKLEIAGLGGSYGTERLAHYQMLPGMGPPETTIYEYPAADDSWETEMADFSEDIRLQRTPLPGIVDAQAALRIAEQIRMGRQP